jgi:hypothetical protein
VVNVGVRKHDCGRRNAMQSAEPVRSTINHDPSIFVLNQQCAMASVLTRTRLNFATRAKER